MRISSALSRSAVRALLAENSRLLGSGPGPRRLPVLAVRARAGLVCDHEGDLGRRRSLRPGVSARKRCDVDVAHRVGVVARERVARAEEDTRPVRRQALEAADFGFLVLFDGRLYTELKNVQNVALELQKMVVVVI